LKSVYVCRIFNPRAPLYILHGVLMDSDES
jgi:hypothetical protein